MRFISTDEGFLPPTDKDVLILCKWENSNGTLQEKAHLVDARFNPRKGWNVNDLVHVLYWAELPEVPLPLNKDQIDLSPVHEEEDTNAG